MCFLANYSTLLTKDDIPSAIKVNTGQLHLCKYKKYVNHRNGDFPFISSTKKAYVLIININKALFYFMFRKIF